MGRNEEVPDNQYTSGQRHGIEGHFLLKIPPGCVACTIGYCPLVAQ